MVDELFSASGVLLRRDAVEAGYDDNHLGRLVRAKAIQRIRQGAYARFPHWEGLADRERQLLLSEAVMRQYDDGVALSHGSAVVRHLGPDHGLDLGKVHLTHFEGQGRRSAGLVHHKGECGVLDITRVNDHWITSPARTVLDVAMLYGLEVGVVVADDFIHRGMTSTEEIEQLYERCKEWPGALVLRLVTRLATGKSESVGESLGWLMFRNQRLPRPEQQFEIFHPDGALAGRTDWAWPERKLLGEFDGKVKYLRFRRPGESITDAVLREKSREDMLRELTGWKMIRLIWADLFVPEATARRILAALALAA